MENKITVGNLSSLMSQSSGKSKKQCDDFLREFFRLASEILQEGEPIKIKGFGTFKLVDIEGRTGVNVNTGAPQQIAPHKKIVFVPAKELATVINAPFDDFESVEMEDEMPEDYLLENEPIEQEETEQPKETEVPVITQEPETSEEQAPTEESGDENVVPENILEAGSVEEGEDDEITYEAYHETASEIKEEPVALPEYEYAEQPADSTGNEDTASQVEYVEPAKSRFGIGFLIGALSTFAVCAVIFMLGCFFDWWPVNFGKPEVIAEQVSPVADAQEMEEELPAEEEEVQPVYDTVSTTRYLTTIAREHYGNFNFWPYIYIENQSILGHPDRITPGTQVVVPDLSKYGVDPNRPEDVAEAKRKAQEIYAKYR